MKQTDKTIDGVTLTRVGNHEWSARFDGHDVTFTAYLGRYNKKVNGWHACSEERKPDNGHAVFSTSGNSLTLCVNRAQEFYSKGETYESAKF